MNVEEAAEQIRQAVADMVVPDAGAAVFHACAIDAGSIYLSTDEAHLDGKAGTGDFAYAEIAEVIDYDVYDHHYNLDAEAQKTSEYAKRAGALVAYLKANAAKVFEGLTLHDEFVVYAAEHGY